MTIATNSPAAMIPRIDVFIVKFMMFLIDKKYGEVMEEERAENHERDQDAYDLPAEVDLLDELDQPRSFRRLGSILVCLAHSYPFFFHATSGAGERPRSAISWDNTCRYCPL